MDPALAAILALAALLRLAAVLWLADTIPYTDYFYYHEAGRMQAADWSFFFRRGALDAYAKLNWWPPGYPLFLAMLYTLCGPSFRVAVGLQVVLGTLVCGLTGAIGTRAAGRPVGLVAAFLVAVNPTYIFTTNLIASENLFALWLVLGLWLAGRASARPRRSAALAGISFGAAALTRAAGLCVPLVVAAWQLRRGRGARPAALTLLLATALTIAPWTLRNVLVTGHPVLVCAGGGLNFYFGHNDGPLGYRPLQGTPLAGQRDAAGIDRAGWRAGLQYIAAHPLGVLRHSGSKLVALFAPPTYALHANSAILIPDAVADPSLAPLAAAARQKQARKDVLLHGVFKVLAALHSYLLLGGALAAVLFAWRRLPAELRLAAWLALAWVGVHLVFWAQPRFRYPMEIPLALLAAWALVWPRSGAGEAAEGEAP
jgi:4-amino-4-deoxy-L-arabinose transferase-like glycosyltransferase